MAEVVVMPAAGNSVESCLLTSWLVAVGDAVTDNTLLAEIETDKSTMEVPVGVAGTVLALLVGEGDEVPVKEPIAVVGAPGEAVDPALLGGGKDPSPEAAPVAAETPASSAPAAAPTPVAAPRRAEPGDLQAPHAASPRARGLAGSLGVDVNAVAGSGPAGRVIARDVQAAAPYATAGARAIAGQAVAATAGSGLGGRLTRSDVAGGSPVAPAAAVPTPVVAPTSGSVTETPLKGVRKIIAERMMASLAGSAQLTYTATAPAAKLMALRARFKKSDPALGFSAITIGDLVGFAAVQTLKKHPAINSHIVDNVVRTFADINLGMAVDTPRGLLVPTLSGAGSLTLREFSAQSKELANEALGGSINPDLLQGGTFTVSNLGSFGIESFTPIINLPQVAILGVDAIFPRATIGADGTVGVEQRIGFSLTADHRLIDGADAARYLKDLCAAIADIDLIAMG